MLYVPLQITEPLTITQRMSVTLIAALKQCSEQEGFLQKNCKTNAMNVIDVDVDGVFVL